MVLFLYYKARTQRFRQLQEKLEQQVAHSSMEIAEREKDLLESKSYARQIAETLMPAKPVLDIQGAETFVFYRPSDTGAGDFFRSYGRNGSTLVAAVDVFADGLPGTFYSLLGHSNLSQLIEQEQESDPASILGKLRERVMTAQARSGEVANLSDRLEVAICAVDAANRTVTFSAANKSMLLLRNGEVTELLGDPEAIGGEDQSTDASYSNQKVTLEKGDALYLFTDGITKQLGGKTAEPFNLKRFSQALEGAHDRSMSEQATVLEQRFNAWVGAQAQQDDVLVIGMRF